MKLEAYHVNIFFLTLMLLILINLLPHVDLKDKWRNNEEV